MKFLASALGAPPGPVRAVAVAALIALAVSLGMPAPAAAARAETRFVFANPSTYDTLDPHAAYDNGRMAPRLNLYDSLLRWEGNPPRLMPWLASSYRISDDGLTYTFRLNRRVLFHDGSPVRASDVVYSIERILAMKKGAYPLFKGLVAPGSTEAPDARTVVFHLSHRSGRFLSMVPAIYVVNADEVRAHEAGGDWGAAWLASHEAGSGAYVLKSYDPAQGFVATRFARHFKGWGPRYLDEIEFRTVTRSSARMRGLMDDDFQGTDGYLPLDLVKQLKSSADVNVDEQESLRIFYAILHNGRAPLNDVHFRKALSYAFDYGGFIDGTLGGSVVRDPVPLPNAFRGASKTVKGFSFDLAKAKEELAKVKAPLRELTIGAISGYSQSEQAAALLRQGLNEIGVKARILSEPWPVVSRKMRDKAQMYDVLFLWRSAYYPDPENWVGEMYACDQVGASNNSWYCNPAVDKLLMEARDSTDMARRRRDYDKAATLVAQDAAGIFVYNTKWFGPYSKRVKGVRYCPVGNGQEMRWVHY